MVRGLCVFGLVALALAAANPAQAKGLGGFLKGLNGVLTAPADPVIDAIEPPDDFDEVPAPALSGRVFGVVYGTVFAAYRAAAGAVDVALTPLWVVPTLSPDARFAIVPGAREKSRKKK